MKTIQRFYVDDHKNFFCTAITQADFHTYRRVLIFSKFTVDSNPQYQRHHHPSSRAEQKKREQAFNTGTRLSNELFFATFKTLFSNNPHNYSRGCKFSWSASWHDPPALFTES